MKENLVHVKKGENESLEFKVNFNKETIETLVAFANTNGGDVYLGVNDAKEVIGISLSEESIQQFINQIKQSTHPQLIPEVRHIVMNGKNVVVFSVQEFPVKPVSYRNKYFKRIANSNHILNPTEIATEYLKTMNSSWDYYPDTAHSIDAISLKKVTSFIQKITERTGQKINETPLDFLKKLEIIRDQKLTFGAYLLFAKEYCSISDVQVGRFKSDITIIDSISLNTDLFTETEQIIAFIKKHLMVEYIITDAQISRIERFDYPLDAIREIVVNMIVHRDYKDSGASVIKIFDDRIEFYNPGDLYGGITINDLLTNNYTSKSRNKLVAKAFKEVGLIERYGSGIKRILNICFDYGIIPPNFESIQKGLKVTLFKEKIKNVVENVVENVVDIKKEQIIDFIVKNSKITTKEIAFALKINERTVQRKIKELKKLKILKRIGSDRAGYWEIVN